MMSNGTFILRAGLDGKMSIYRDIEIEPSKSLYRLAEAIVTAFGFEFDHAFGFYSGLKPATLMSTLPDTNCSPIWAMPQRASAALRKPGFHRRLRRSATP